MKLQKIFALRLRTKIFLRLVFLFFLPLLGLSSWFLYRQYENLQDRMYFSFLSRAGLLAERLENLVKDRIAPRGNHPLLLKRGTALRPSAIPVPREIRDLVDRRATGTADLFYIFIQEGSPRVLYIRPRGAELRYFLFEAEFIAEFMFNSQLIELDEFFFLLNQDDVPALSNLVSQDLEIPSEWIVHLKSGPENLFRPAEGRVVKIGQERFLLSVFSVSGLPLRLAIAKPMEHALEPMRREIFTQALLLGAVLCLFLLYSLLAAREEIHPLRTIEEFLKRVSRRDFSYVPRIHARDERRDIFQSLNRLRMILRRLDRTNALELEKRNRRLEELNEQKNNLLGTAAHDLRNPLGAIQGFSQFLIEELSRDLSAEHRMFLERIHGSSESMLELINDLLDITRIEAGALELNLRETDPALLVGNCLEINRLLAARKEITIEEDFSPGVVSVFLDPPRIEQVVNNLIGNAIKYSHPGTRITVRLKRDRGGVLFSVADQGQGIPRNELGAIFRPFMKSKSTRTTAGEGSTGLGLAIVKKIVEGHGGQISVESEVGQGSVFTVFLPSGGKPAGNSAV